MRRIIGVLMRLSRRSAAAVVPGDAAKPDRIARLVQAEKDRAARSAAGAVGETAAQRAAARMQGRILR